MSEHCHTGKSCTQAKLLRLSSNPATGTWGWIIVRRKTCHMYHAYVFMYHTCVFVLSGNDIEQTVNTNEPNACIEAFIKTRLSNLRN
jgi:hypothetical protein